MEHEEFFAPWRMVAAFSDGARLTFDGFTEEQAKSAAEAAQDEHGDITWWDHVTDVNYENGRYYKTLPLPPCICRIVLGGDFSDIVTRWHPMGR